MRNRDQARKKTLKTKSVEDFNIYKRLRNCVTSRLRKAKSDFFQHTELDDCRGDPKAFWKLMKKVLPTKNRTTKIDKLVIPKDIGDSLNLHFASVATNLLSARSPTTTASTFNLDSNHDPPSQFPSSLESSSPTNFHFRPTTDVEISNMLANLIPTKLLGMITSRRRSLRYPRTVYFSVCRV
jgi:hypothetical protein